MDQRTFTFLQHVRPRPIANLLHLLLFTNIKFKKISRRTCGVNSKRYRKLLKINVCIPNSAICTGHVARTSAGPGVDQNI